MRHFIYVIMLLASSSASMAQSPAADVVSWLEGCNAAFPIEAELADNVLTIKHVGDEGGPETVDIPITELHRGAGWWPNTTILFRCSSRIRVACITRSQMGVDEDGLETVISSQQVHQFYFNSCADAYEVRRLHRSIIELFNALTGAAEPLRR